MNLKEALKQFRRQGYVYKDKARGVIVANSAEEATAVARAAVDIMVTHGGDGGNEYNVSQRVITMRDGATLKFRVKDQVDYMAGNEYSFIGMTKLALADGGVAFEHRMIALHRSSDVADQDMRYVTIEGVA